MTGTRRMRIDQLLVARGMFESRARARAAIEAGQVMIEGAPVTKPAQMVSAEAAVEAGPAHPYVSRGGVKLAAALAHFKVDPKRKICLDVGASTGGFTDVLLRAGARRVYAVDVGSGQLHPSLRDRAGVVSLEKSDIRKLDPERISDKVELIAVDVSFISLKLILPVLSRFAAPGAVLLALAKPQFEVGRKLLHKGIVRDLEAQRAACRDIAALAGSLGWEVLGTIESPILGGDGNREFIISARWNPSTNIDESRRDLGANA